MSGWKDAERQAAKILGGLRRVRIDYSESCEDVHHTKYSIEVKATGYHTYLDEITVAGEYQDIGLLKLNQNE